MNKITKEKNLSKTNMISVTTIAWKIDKDNVVKLKNILT
jgi:hypothetical protein